ncbi:MAG: thiol-disulfide oxidoreductase DCC family protein [Ferruginibacter sp.]
MKEQPVILFDGVCNLCNSAVQFIIKRDKRAVFLFAALQSGTAQTLLQKAPATVRALDSFVLVENNKLYTRSAAALRVCRYLRGGWPLLYGFIIVPAFIRDGVYNWIARNRYKWFGRRQECMIPTPALKARFLT